MNKRNVSGDNVMKGANNNKVLKVHSVATKPTEYVIDVYKKVFGITHAEAIPYTYSGTCCLQAGNHDTLMPLKNQLASFGLDAKIYWNHCELVVYIDYVNGVDYISDAFEKVLVISPNVAEKYASKVIQSEFCVVKKGSLEGLKPLKDQLNSLGLCAKIE